MEKKKKSRVALRVLCEGALMVALAQILSYLKLWELPQGGSVTIGMFPIFLFCIRWGFGPRKVLRLAEAAFGKRYDRATLLKWLRNFYRRFFSQQFKRSCLPDGPKVGSVALSPRGDWRMPSDAVNSLWMEELEGLE